MVPLPDPSDGVIRVTLGQDAPDRLDKALARAVPEAADLSRTRLMRMIADGAVSCDGMMVTDALNGLWISALISRADARAAFASRVMSVGIAGLSFMVAMLGVRKYFAPSVEQLMPETSAVIGLSVIALTGVVFLCALYFKDRQHG